MVRVDSVEAAVADAELGHHVVVLMRQVVAVHHVRSALETGITARLREARPVKIDQNRHRLALTDIHDVLGSLLVRQHPADPVGAVDDPEFDEVDMNRVKPTT